MASIKLYNPEPLASSLVGNPIADQSGRMLAGDVLENTSATQSQEASAQAQNNALQGEIARSNIHNVGNAIANQRQIERQQQAHLDLQAADSASVTAGMALVDLHDKIKNDFKANPDAAPDEFKKQAADTIKALVDQHQEWNPTVKAAAIKSANNDVLGLYKDMSHWKFDQATQNAIEQAGFDSHRLETAPDGQDAGRLQMKFDAIEARRTAWTNTLGAAKADKLIESTLNGAAKNFLQGYVDNNPAAVQDLVKSETISHDIVDQKTQDSYVKEAQNRIDAINNEETQVQKAARNKQLSINENTFATAIAANDMQSVEAARIGFINQIHTLQNAPNNENSRATMKDLVTKVEHLSGKIEEHQRELAAEARHLDTEARAAAREDLRAHKEQVAQERQAQKDFFVTPQAQELKGSADNALSALPKAASIHGTATEQKALDVARTALKEAYDAGALGPKYMQSTARYYTVRMGHIEALGQLVEAHRKNPNAIDSGLQLLPWFGKAHETESILAPAPAVVRNAGVSQDAWTKQHADFIDSYKRTNGIPLTQALDPKELKYIRDHLTTKVAVQGAR